MDWRVARAFAVFEFELSAKSAHPEWGSAKLSKYPVVVYDGLGNPKYYEFPVVSLEGKAIGAVSVVAQKKDGMSVSHILEYGRDYRKIFSRGNVKLVALNYPNSIGYTYGVSRGAPVREVRSLDSGEVIEVPIEVSWVEALSRMDIEDLYVLG